MNYKNKVHELIYKTYVIKCPYKLPSRTLAAIYLLSADRNAWKRMKRNIEKKEINFNNVSLSGATPYEYMIIKTASDLYSNDCMHLNIFDLGDPFLISNKSLELIFQAIRIARNGYDELDLNKTFN